MFLNYEVAFSKIKSHLESKGVKFGEYYGGTIIYNSGPKFPQFFKNVNEGSYSVDVLIVPNDAITRIVDEEILNKLLGE